MAKNRLSQKEVSMVKGILEQYPRITNQEILSWFSIPGRLINAGRISEIKNRQHHTDVIPCSKERVDEFMSGVLTLAHLNDDIALSGVGGNNLARRERAFGVLDVEIGTSVLRVTTRESSYVEFKESYEARKIPVYLKTLSAMLNSGHLGRVVFGVADRNGEIVGVNPRSISTERLQQILGEHFDPSYEVVVEYALVGVKRLACVRAVASPSLPVICRKDKIVRENEGKGVSLEEGGVYYRYGNITRKIKHAEMRALLNREVDDEVRRRLDNLESASGERSQK